ncbi:MAG: CPBP family intramembrane metalloprotease [Planctomycetes bacterium]|nr:CPBP family intramembrane metalloprotease [Planctomycetota bacterium]
MLLGLVFPLLAVRGQRRMKATGVTFDTSTKISTYWTNSIVLAVAGSAVLVAWTLGDRETQELGLRAGDPDQRWLTAALAAVFGVWYVAEGIWHVGTAKQRARTAARLRRDTPFVPETRRELAHFTVLALSAGVWEELVFRGFLITYLAWFAGDSIVGLVAAVMIPAAIFGFSHLYQGWKYVFKIAFMAGVFGAIFVVSGSLWLLMALHVVVDLIGGYLALVLLRGSPAESA